jgi:phenylacetate-coenzyme A ligase PaaK-like adenylate-forming protein
MNFEDPRKKLINEVHQLLPEHLERLVWTKEQLRNFQTIRLREILSIAKQNTGWYKEALRNINPNGFTLDDLGNLPVLKKDDVMNSWNDVISVPGLTKEIAEDHIEMLREGKIDNPYFDDRYLFIATGGSSGKRGLFIWDFEFLKETACITYRYLVDQEIRCGYNGPMKLATIEAPTLLHGSAHLFTINVRPEIEVRILSAVEPLVRLNNILNEYRPNYLVGYASVVAELARDQLQGSLNIQPRWVSTNSEPLDEDMRSIIKEAWGIEARNSWGSVEIGCVAVETGDRSGMIIGEDGVILEPVDDNLQPVRESRDARKVLATSLINRSMPIIRYVIEDVLEIEDDHIEFPAYRRIKSILGRADNWFVYKNSRIHPMAFRDVMSQVKEIDEYQILQTSDGAAIRLICEGKPDLEEMSNRIKENLRKQGLENPHVTVDIVSTLPRHPETGKVKRFIPLKS